MLSLYQLIVNRVQTLVLADVGLVMEADSLALGAARKVELLRLANRYEAEGLAEVAKEIRDSVQALQPEQPLARSLPVTANLLATGNGCDKGVGTNGALLLDQQQASTGGEHQTTVANDASDGTPLSLHQQPESVVEQRTSAESDNASKEQPTNPKTEDGNSQGQKKSRKRSRKK